MDFITQTLLGTIAAQTLLTRRLGRAAALFGALGGALPDFDVVLRPLADPALPFELHRHFTHSLVFIPIGGALATAPFLLRRAWRRQAHCVFAAATIGCATHGLLDNLTSYGTHLFWPFLAERTAWDAMSIIDPIFTGLLMLGVFLSLIIGHMRPAAIGLALAVLYIAFGFVQHERALHAQQRLAERRGHLIQHGRVTPTLGNLIVWRSVYESDGMLYADAVRAPMLDAPMVREGRALPRIDLDDIVPSGAVAPRHAARVREVFQAFSSFATGFTALVDGDLDSSLIVGDVRYSLDTAGFEPIWGLRIGPKDAPVPVQWAPLMADRPGRLRDFWYELLEPGTTYVPIAATR